MLLLHASFVCVSLRVDILSGRAGATRCEAKEAKEAEVPSRLDAPSLPEVPFVPPEALAKAPQEAKVPWHRNLLGVS